MEDNVATALAMCPFPSFVPPPPSPSCSDLAPTLPWLRLLKHKQLVNDISLGLGLGSGLGLGTGAVSFSQLGGNVQEKNV